MINRNFIKRILKSVQRRNRGLSDHQLMHPKRDWFIGISLAIVILIVGIFWSLNQYWSYSNIKPESGQPAGTDIIIYREQQVKQALTELDSRQNRYDEIVKELQIIKTPIQPVAEDATEVIAPAPDEEELPVTETQETEEQTMIQMVQ